MMNRRLLSMSVRGLMLLVLVAACGLGWVTHKARQQKLAVEAIRKYGDLVFYDYEHVNGNPIPGREPRAPKWLRRIVGDEYFRNVTFVCLDESGVGATAQRTSQTDDEVLRHLDNLTDIKVLTLNGGRATDAAMKHVAKLPHLEILSLHDARELTDEGIAQLPGLGSIKELWIDGPKLTDAAMKHIVEMTRLEYLVLCDARGLTDEGIARLAGLGSLKTLDIWGSRMTDVGFRSLMALNKLEELTVFHSRLTDKGLEDIGGLVHLKKLVVGAMIAISRIKGLPTCTV